MPDPTALNSAAQPLVMVVDDVPVMRQMLAEMVTMAGYHSVTANDGESAISLAMKLRPDLILLDIVLPGMDGFAVMQELKQRHQTVHIPVILLTGMDDLDLKLKGFNLGAVDYITKPFQIVEVQARLRLHIKLSMAIRAIVQAQKEKLRQIKDAQQSLFVTSENLPQAQFAVRLNQLLEAGGDFYDVVQITPSITGYFVADVSGHDIHSGFITPAIKALLKQNCTAIYAPLESMIMINNVLNGLLPSGKYLTATWAVLNRMTMRATVVSMAHPNVIVKRKNGKVEILPSEGDVLGAFPDVIFNQHEFRISPGDRFYLYTDGLIEGTHLANIWVSGVEKFAELIASLPPQNSRESDISDLCYKLHIDASQIADDLLLMCVEV